MLLDDKLEALRRLLRSYGSCLVAYSGGVDSVFLAVVAHETLGGQAVAAIADTPSLPRRELEEAREIARRFSIPLNVVRSKEFDNPEYLANPGNRCYFCKLDLFRELVPLAHREGLAVVVHGENASDTGDYRPGSKAAAELLVRAPLKEVGLTKADIRELSARMGLPTADKPEMACLSSRVPYGESISPEKLKMIESAEYCLRDLGIRDVRVRHHELTVQTPDGAKTTAHLARIELGVREMGGLFEHDRHLRIGPALKKIGYAFVTLDLQGYRRGSFNGSASSGV